MIATTTGLGEGATGGRLISFGGLLADLVVSVDALPARGEDALARGFEQTVGGGFAVLAAAARLGMRTALAGVLGDDAIAAAARRALRAEGIELLFPAPRDGGSGVCLVLVDAAGERTMVTVEGVESRLRPEDFAAVEPAPGDVVYMSGYELLYPHGPTLAAWVGRARPDRLVFDPGPLIGKIAPELLAGLLEATHWLSLNAAEAAALTGEEDPAAAARAALARPAPGSLAGPSAPVRLPHDPPVDGPRASAEHEPSARRHGGGVVVRTGAAGCVVATRGEEARVVPAFPTVAVDTTAAGDTHVGAFVAALARGLAPVEACRWANAAAALVVAAPGQAAPPRLAELREILAAGDVRGVLRRRAQAPSS